MVPGLAPPRRGVLSHWRRLHPRWQATKSPDRPPPCATRARANRCGSTRRAHSQHAGASSRFTSTVSRNHAHCVAYSITVPLPPASDHGVNALTAPQVPTAQLVQPNAQLLAPGMDVPMQHISLLEASALTPPHTSTEQIVESNARLIVQLSHFL